MEAIRFKIYSKIERKPFPDTGGVIMLVVALNGSPNKDGNTAFLLHKVLEVCGENQAETELIHVAEVMETVKSPFCNTCSIPCNGNCYGGTMLEDAFDRMKKADAIVLGSPVYFGTVSAQLKAFFDKSRRLRNEKALLGKIGAGVTVAGSKYGGQETTMRALHDMMLIHGMCIVGDGSSEEDCGHHGVCAARPASEDEFAVRRARVLGMRIIEACGR